MKNDDDDNEKCVQISAAISTTPEDGNKPASNFTNFNTSQSMARFFHDKINVFKVFLIHQTLLDMRKTHIQIEIMLLKRHFVLPLCHTYCVSLWL